MIITLFFIIFIFAFTYVALRVIFRIFTDVYITHCEIDNQSGNTVIFSIFYENGKHKYEKCHIGDARYNELRGYCH